MTTDKEKLPSEKGVLKAAESDKNRGGEAGKNLYGQTCDYLKNVLESIRRGNIFSLNPGLQIIQRMADVQSSTDALFLETFQDYDPHHFMIHHHVNVAIYAIKMAENLGWNKDRQKEIGTAGLLHDVGMGLIPNELLFKEERLSDDELIVIKKRSDYAYHILKTFKEACPYLAECALQINERVDGFGYPMGLKGDEIHEYAQIIGLVDMYEALSHSRPQREKLLHFTAVKEIITSGKNRFQKRHLKTLLNIFSIFPIFSYVRLNSNAIGRVIETYPDQPMRPKIRIVYDSQNRKVLTERIINLQENPLLFIVDSVNE